MDTNEISLSLAPGTVGRGDLIELVIRYKQQSSYAKYDVSVPDYKYHSLGLVHLVGLTTYGYIPNSYATCSSTLPVYTYDGSGSTPRKKLYYSMPITASIVTYGTSQAIILETNHLEGSSSNYFSNYFDDIQIGYRIVQYATSTN